MWHTSGKIRAVIPMRVSSLLRPTTRVNPGVVKGLPLRANGFLASCGCARMGVICPRGYHNCESKCSKYSRNTPVQPPINTVFVIVFENKDYSKVIGNAAAP